MADLPFDRLIMNPRERPLSRDVNRIQSQLDYALRFMWREYFAQRASDSSDASLFTLPRFLGSGLQVVASSPVAMSVQVSPGVGFIDDPTDLVSDIGGLDDLDDLARLKPLLLAAAQSFVVPAAPSSPNSRIDIIEVKIDRRREDPQTRDVLDPITGTFVPTSGLNKTLSFALDGRVGSVSAPANSSAGIGYKIGVAGNPGVVPSTSPGYVKIAQINVGAGVASIDRDAIVDERKLAGAGGVVTASARWRLRWNGGSPLVTTESIVAPPGTRLGALGLSSSKGSLRIYVLGGHFTEIAHHLSVQETGSETLAATEVIVPTLRGEGSSSGMIDEVGDGGAELSTILTASPSLKAGVGQRIVNQVAKARFIDGSGPNATDSALEDVMFSYTARLSY